MYNTAFENLSDMRNEFDKAKKYKKIRMFFLEALTLFVMFATGYIAFIMFVS
tara:strand:- start:1774 stop:1929 length:156 start_codon:yes stop_codon:yes gene_type:complete